jgi:hypothetical protein
MKEKKKTIKSLTELEKEMILEKRENYDEEGKHK